MIRIGKAGKKLAGMLINYIKLFLIPVVFVFMLLALIAKGIKMLIKKATA